MERSSRIFVFGSNLAGRHGKGAAKYAREFCGAIYGQAEGLQGNSYGIPTKDERLRSRSLDDIRQSIERFIQFARENPQYQFNLTPIGCGLAGFRKDQMLPFLKDKPENVHFTKEWDE